MYTPSIDLSLNYFRVKRTIKHSIEKTVQTQNVSTEKSKKL